MQRGLSTTRKGERYEPSVEKGPLGFFFFFFFFIRNDILHL